MKVANLLLSALVQIEKIESMAVTVGTHKRWSNTYEYAPGKRGKASCGLVLRELSEVKEYIQEALKLL